ncbi:MAG: hypothetical protein CW344_13025 [Parageobacillus thermoglucosidasius]|nr:hypothetical protein [Parageobacillus thermoglucosidasius]
MLAGSFLIASATSALRASACLAANVMLVITNMTSDQTNMPAIKETMSGFSFSRKLVILAFLFGPKAYSGEPAICFLL